MMSTAKERVSETLRVASGAAAQAVYSLTGSNAKIHDLAPDVISCNKNDSKMTSDYGAPISDTDHWLKVVDPHNPNGHGPSLLEDQFAREKVSKRSHGRYLSSYVLYFVLIDLRYTGSTMNVFQKGWFMPVVQVLMDILNY